MTGPEHENLSITQEIRAELLKKTVTPIVYGPKVFRELTFKGITMYV